MGSLLKAYDQRGAGVVSNFYHMTKEMLALKFGKGTEFWQYEMQLRSALALSGLEGSLTEEFPATYPGQGNHKFYREAATPAGQVSAPVTEQPLPDASQHTGAGGLQGADLRSAAGGGGATPAAFGTFAPATAEQCLEYLLALQYAWRTRDTFLVHLMCQSLQGAEMALLRVHPGCGQAV
jgi:hypothetical protein